ncbi:MAG: ABC transporter permease [Bacteroidota bacterium]|nr:ABC transporter permease [Bacteroidota bacterium]
MFKNYFKTAIRNFSKNKLTTIINVFGLSIGISAALIIYFIIQYDFSFDKHEPGRDRIYRIVTEGESWKNAGVPVPLHEEVQSNVSGIEATSLILQYNDDNPKISIPNGNYHPVSVFKKQESIAFVDSNYFSLFPHQWLAGKKEASLINPYNLVLSESRARLYFPNVSAEQLVGKTIVFNDTLPMTLTGIVKDLKDNSDFSYQMFISLATVSGSDLKGKYSWDEWNSTNSNFQTMVKLLPGVQASQINKQLKGIFKKHDTDPDDAKIIHRLQPLSDVHYNTELEGKVNLSTVNNLILLVVFLLLLGAINFINLSTAQSVQRAKEIGIRKTLGSSKSSLIFQFLTETFLLTLVTTVLSVVISPLLLKAFGGFIPDGLQFSTIFKQLSVWLFLLLLIVIVSVLAGLYPAFILSRFQPIKVLKSQAFATSGTTRTAWLRQALLVFQFVIAQVFIIGVIVVDKQIHYSTQKDMGFRKDAIITFSVPFDFYHPNNKKFVLKDELKNMPEIQEVSLGNAAPAINGQMSSSIAFKEGKKDMKLSVDTRSGDTSFLGVYNIKLVSGRNIMPSDTANELLINETGAKQLGFTQPADAVGHRVVFGSSSMPVVGVMHDFNLASVRSIIHPLIYYAAPKRGWTISIALQPNPNTWHSAITKMQAAWKRLYPDNDFDYAFFDKKISDFYKEDRQLSLLLTWSAGVAICISCLGLLGLIIFITNQRTKEIGVRKVLGASVAQIITLLSGDFAKLIAIAFVIAIPIAWWLTHNWLQNFAYHTELSWWIFLVSGVIMIIAAFTVLCIRAGKAALANPVKSLRSE